jgi:hypothetical protein
MANAVEGPIATGMMQTLGSPMFIGIAVVAFFLAMIMLVPTHPALKVLGFMGALLLASTMIPMGGLLFGILFGVIIWFTLSRMFQR